MAGLSSMIWECSRPTFGSDPHCGRGSGKAHTGLVDPAGASRRVGRAGSSLEESLGCCSSITTTPPVRAGLSDVLSAKGDRGVSLALHGSVPFLERRGLRLEATSVEESVTLLTAW